MTDEPTQRPHRHLSSLTPTTRPDLQKLVKEMTLTYGAKSHYLLAARLSTQQGDTMTFWFSYPPLTQYSASARYFHPQVMSFPFSQTTLYNATAIPSHSVNHGPQVHPQLSCFCSPWPPARLGATRIAPIDPTISDPVRDFTKDWPTQTKRPFFATITALGHRVTASGIFDYTNQNDFRMTALNENGMILFDARKNWAGTHVLRSMPGLDTSIVEQLVRDLALAWRMPTDFTKMRVDHANTLVQDLTPEGIKATYTFARVNPHADDIAVYHLYNDVLRLQSSEFSIGTFDTLTITYKTYNSKGWVKDMSVSRPARLYSMQLTFTDEP